MRCQKQIKAHEQGWLLLKHISKAGFYLICTHGRGRKESIAMFVAM